MVRGIKKVMKVKTGLNPYNRLSRRKILTVEWSIHDLHIIAVIV